MLHSRAYICPFIDSYRNLKAAHCICANAHLLALVLVTKRKIQILSIKKNLLCCSVSTEEQKKIGVFFLFSLFSIAVRFFCFIIYISKRNLLWDLFIFICRSTPHLVPLKSIHKKSEFCSRIVSIINRFSLVHRSILLW